MAFGAKKNVSAVKKNGQSSVPGGHPLKKEGDTRFLHLPKTIQPANEKKPITFKTKPLTWIILKESSRWVAFMKHMFDRKTLIRNVFQ